MIRERKPFHALGDVEPRADSHPRMEVVELVLAEDVGHKTRPRRESNGEQLGLGPPSQDGLSRAVHIRNATKEVPLRPSQPPCVASAIEHTNIPSTLQSGSNIVLTRDIQTVTESTVMQHKHWCLIIFA